MKRPRKKVVRPTVVYVQAWVFAPYKINGIWRHANRFPVGSPTRSRAKAQRDLDAWKKSHVQEIKRVNGQAVQGVCNGGGIRVRLKVCQVWPQLRAFGKCPYHGTHVSVPL